MPLPRCVSVLIVEDDALQALHLREKLLEWGYDVPVTAQDERQAIAMARQFKPDLAIMDLRLANGASGFKLAQYFYRELRIRCIFVSGNLDQQTRMELTTVRPYGFVDKPIHDIKLKQILATANEEIDCLR